MPLFEELVRRALAVRERETAQTDSNRVRELAQLLRDAEAGTTMLVHCAWCGRLQVGDEWLDLAAESDESLEITDSLIRKSSHGICPDCFAHVSETAEVQRAGWRTPAPSFRSGVTDQPPISSFRQGERGVGPVFRNDPWAG
jgi:hypothetical protein